MYKYQMYCCRVCGLYLGEAPWGEDGETPSYEICVCCGVHIGYEDITYEFVERYRKNWLKNGAKWFRPKFKPQEWNLEEQLKNAWHK